MAYTTEDIRNIALAGQAGAGKTTLFEALLHAGGAIQTAGSVERGTTVSDHDPLEKERKHSSARRSHRSTRGDCPHQSDRHARVARTSAVRRCRRSPRSKPARSSSMRTTGIAHGTRRLMDRAKAAQSLPHHRRQQDRSRRHRSRRRRRGTARRVRHRMPADQPAGEERQRRRRLFLPAERRTPISRRVAEAHQHIIDQVVEINETVMDHYLDDGEAGLSGQELHDAFEQCLREGHLVPICFSSGAHRRRREGIAGRSPRNCCRIRRKAIRRRSSKAAARMRRRSRRQARSEAST